MTCKILSEFGGELNRNMDKPMGNSIKIFPKDLTVKIISAYLGPL